MDSVGVTKSGGRERAGSTRRLGRVAARLVVAAVAWCACAAAFAEPPAAPSEEPASPAATAASGEESPAAPLEAPASAASSPPAPLAAAAGEPSEAPPAPSRDRFLPRLDVYFPEGELDLRLNRLINRTFFEGQVKYNFVKGDITAFLRYRYYGLRRITQFAVFDSIAFNDLDQSTDEFDRVRGYLGLLEWPHSVHHRTFLLAEADRISSNRRELRFINNTTNAYLRLGYQVGTGTDARSNAIVGEFRAKSERLFTATREIGPGQTGFTAAATYSSDVLGDFAYVKTEVEALKRFDLSPQTFVIGRLHGGLFPWKRRVERPDDSDPTDRFSIPRAEFFRLEGRDNLRGLSGRVRGTYEAHATVEWFIPWFRDEARRALRAEWQTFYFVAYLGAGQAGYDSRVFRNVGDWVSDIGLGFEAAMKVRQYRFFLSGIAARAFESGSNGKLRISIKSYH